MSPTEMFAALAGALVFVDVGAWSLVALLRFFRGVSS